MHSTQQIPSATIARLLSNPELTSEQRDVVIALSEGRLSDEEAIQKIMELETARNTRENTAAAKSPKA